MENSPNFAGSQTPKDQLRKKYLKTFLKGKGLKGVVINLKLVEPKNKNKMKGIR